MKGYVPELDCLWPGFVVYFINKIKASTFMTFWLYAYIQDWLVKNNWKENFSSVE